MSDWPSSELRRNRWKAASAMGLAAALYYLLIWLAFSSAPNAGGVITLTAAAGFISYRWGADDMWEMWKLRDALNESLRHNEEPL